MNHQWQQPQSGKYANYRIKYGSRKLNSSIGSHQIFHVSLKLIIPYIREWQIYLLLANKVYCQIIHIKHKYALKRCLCLCIPNNIIYKYQQCI